MPGSTKWPTASNSAPRLGLLQKLELERNAVKEVLGSAGAALVAARVRRCGRSSSRRARVARVRHATLARRAGTVQIRSPWRPNARIVETNPIAAAVPIGGAN